MNSADISSSWYTIVNPVAGRGKGLSDWPQISSLLYQEGVVFEAHFTQRKYHAVEMAFEAVKRGFRKIMIVGGDGTLHETVCGLMMQEEVKSTDVLLSVFAVGTGNDWMRMFGIPKRYSEVVQSIKQGHTFLQDVGRVTYYESKVKQLRYLCNVGGVAYDAAVCKSVNKLKAKGLRGTWLYIRSAFVEAVRYRSQRCRIVCDGKEVFRNKLFTATVGIGKYTGGGLSQTPYAVADDGLFDLTIIPDMNRIALFSRFGTLYTDNIYNINGVTLNRCARLEIYSEGREIELELDGEILGVSDFSFEIVEKALRVVVSERFLSCKL